MTTIEIDSYLDENLAVWNAAMGYRQQVELCKELQRKRKARQRAEAIRRERRRKLATVLTVAALLGIILAACVSLVNAQNDRTTGANPARTEPINALANVELLNSTAPTVTITPEQVDPLENLPVWEWPEETLLANGYYSTAVPMEYEYQGYMRRYCEEYGCPYNMALAVAEIESQFCMDKLGAVGEVGIMQLNPGPDGAYHAELEAATGLDPATPEGNIAAGCYLLGKYMTLYGDAEKALMCYNMGHSGAKLAWAEGRTSTAYTEKVTEAMERWGCTVNAWNGV